MIKNNRQYMSTKRELGNFYSSLEDLKTNPPTDQALDPLFGKIQAQAIQCQIYELEAEIKEYEALVRGDVKVFECDSLAELPSLLIKARISLNLSQKDLADKLGLKEQQIQRYEATDYESASLSRLLEVSNTLGLKFSQKVELPEGDISLSNLLGKASKVGLSSDFLFRRLAPRDVKSTIKAEVVKQEDSFTVGKIADNLSRVFKWSYADIYGEAPLNIGLELAANFKMPKKRDADFARVYTAYAHYLSIVTTDLAAYIPVLKVPSDPLYVREEVTRRTSHLSLRSLLNYVWDLGIAVLPLNDPGAFHGACWRINGRNVIVVKQKSPYESRWIFDLAHELYHASEEPSEISRSVVEVFEDYPNYSESSEEVSASNYAGYLTLGPSADKYVKECIEEASGRVELLKSTVIKVAERHLIDVGSLANYLAFQLSLQGENWWGTANNLQRKGENPWIIARDVFFERIDISKSNSIDRELILLALTNEEG